jgi:hypothetical protein
MNKVITSARFRVEDWMACAPRLEKREDWLAWSRGVQNHQEETGLGEVSLPPMLRRRISPVGQMAFRVSQALSEQRTARFIFCSRHGEFQRTLRILQSLAARELTSPLDFSLSVHNALAGLLSIAWNNTSGHTTISAGADSFGSGLLEAAACLKATVGEPAMLVYFDDRLPEPYDEMADGAESCIALAMLLNSPRNDGRDLTLRMGLRDQAVPPLSASGQALDFLRFMLSGERKRSSMGERIQWCWERDA